MLFDKNYVNLGKVKEGNSRNFTFVAADNVTIEQAIPSCPRCTKIQIVGQEVQVKFTAEPVPVHLNVTEHKVKKTITIRYKLKELPNTDQVTELYFKAAVTK